MAAHTSRRVFQLTASCSALPAAVNGTAAAPVVSAFAGAAQAFTPAMMQTLVEGLMQGAKDCERAFCVMLLTWHARLCCSGVGAMLQGAQPASG